MITRNRNFRQEKICVSFDYDHLGPGGWGGGASMGPAKDRVPLVHTKKENVLNWRRGEYLPKLTGH